MKLLVIVEETRTGYSAWSPDLPGCIATGRTRAVVEDRMASAAAMHVEGLRKAGEPIPAPSAYATSIEVGEG
jgi:predicted RNase H-like HicB family nuclease